MAIGVVDDKEFETEVSKITPVVKEGVVVDIIKGRGNGNVEVPDSLRKIIGEVNEIDGRKDALALAKQFGISSSSVSAYGNGATSTASYDDSKSSIKDHINRTKERISKKAQNRLVLALNEITPEKLKEAKLKDISSIAKDMSGIVKDMEPEQAREGKDSGPQFIFYSPQFRKEEHFETIIVNE